MICPHLQDGDLAYVTSIGLAWTLDTAAGVAYVLFLLAMMFAVGLCLGGALVNFYVSRAAHASLGAALPQHPRDPGLFGRIDRLVGGGLNTLKPKLSVFIAWGFIYAGYLVLGLSTRQEIGVSLAIIGSQLLFPIQTAVRR